MPTIRDVARRAGVAPITVSRVINREGYVSDETRMRVESAVADLGYVSRRRIGDLHAGQTRTLGLVLTDITNSFWTTAARGVEEAAGEQNFTVILCNTDETEEKQAAYLRVLLRQHVDGLILAPAHSNAAPVLTLQQRGVPVVVIDRHIPTAVDIVRCDSEGGAYRLVRHLLDLGHRRIAILSGLPDVSTAQDRVAGYRRALAEAGLSADEALLFHREFTLAAGEAMARQAMALDPRPTALFAVNNFIAIGALQALHAMGVRVPEDISLVAFDDLPPTLMLEPFLTVASQPAYEMGYHATELLLQRIAGDAPAAYQHIVLPTTLIVRESASPLPE